MPEKTTMSISIPPINILPASSPLAAKPGSSASHRNRGRSGSLVAVKELDTDPADYVDQSAFRNVNGDWVNSKGAWLIHPFLILCGKILLDIIPGMQQELSWTIVNIGYVLLSYLMFHYVTGIPFDSNSGAYDDLTLWEQIDGGAQYTPAKKWLVCTPIALFLISTHYTHYDPWAFAINFSATLFVLLAKLPQFHRQRLRFLPSESGMATPVTPYPPSLPASGRSTPTILH